MNTDPLRPPETDSELDAPRDRSWSGYALLACVIVGVLVILLAGVGRE